MRKMRFKYVFIIVMLYLCVLRKAETVQTDQERIKLGAKNRLYQNCEEQTPGSPLHHEHVLSQAKLHKEIDVSIKER